MSEEIVCKNCQNVFKGHYCNQCGQEGDISRLTISNIGKEFLHGFYHVHGGIFHTIKELFLRPGEVIRGYLAGRRVDYFNPFTYLLVVTLVGGYLLVESGMIEYSRFNIFSSAKTMRFATKHFSYRMLTTIPVYSVIMWQFYRKYRYNFAEHILISTFIVCQSTLVAVIWMIAGNLVELNSVSVRILLYGTFFSMLAYQVYALMHVFNEEKPFVKYLKSISATAFAFYVGFLLLNLFTSLFYST